MVVQHLGFQSLPFESLSFLLTLLATTVTPVFVLSKRWTHLPCGCIINCKRDAYAVASDGGKSKSSSMWRLGAIAYSQIQKSGLLGKLPTQVGGEESKDKCKWKIEERNYNVKQFLPQFWKEVLSEWV